MEALLKHLRLEPIIVPRWMLVIKYSLFALLGVVLARSGSPSIEAQTGDLSLLVYGLLITAGSLLAVVGCVTVEWVEMTGALALWVLLLVYVGAVSGRALSGNLDVQAIALVVLIVSLLPAFRGFGILPRVIRRRVKPAHG